MLTPDLNYMMEVLLNKFGNNISVIYQEMNETEKKQNSHIQQPLDIIIIDNILNIYQLTNNIFGRCLEVERQIIEKGQK